MSLPCAPCQGKILGTSVLTGEIFETPRSWDSEILSYSAVYHFRTDQLSRENANTTCVHSKPDFFGGFNSSASSSLAKSDNRFHSQYGDGSKPEGFFAKDTISLGGSSLKAANLAIVNNITDPVVVYGIMGISFNATESTVVSDSKPAYPNFVEQLKSEGLINRELYSLWLNDPSTFSYSRILQQKSVMLICSEESDGGSILFGGIDTAKYSGPLSTLPMVPFPDERHTIDRVTVGLTSITLTGDSQNSSLFTGGVPAVLDTGAAASDLPPDAVNTLISGLGVGQADIAKGTLSCSLGTGLNLTFGFNNDDSAVVSVPFSNFLQPLKDGDTQVTDQNGNPVCSPLLTPSKTNYVLLGDSFLQSAYAVVDLAQKQVGIAQAVMNATESNIIAVQAVSNGSAPIPSARPIMSTAAISEIPGVSTQAATAAISAAAVPTGIPTQVSLAPLSPTLSISATGTGATPSGTSNAASPMKQAPVQIASLVAGALTLASMLGGALCFLY